MKDMQINPKLDLVFERNSTLSPEKIWQGWTQPETLMKWFCPRPWKVIDCRIELRPGGEFYSVMQGPDGQKMPNSGCYLEVVENKKLVWTNLMTKGFRPNATANLGFPFVVTLLLEKNPKGTYYKAIVCHADEGGQNQHVQMGFQEGWSKAFDQLEELFK